MSSTIYELDVNSDINFINDLYKNDSLYTEFYPTIYFLNYQSHSNYTRITL